LQHPQIGGPILGVGELRRRAFGVPVDERDSAIIGHAGGHPTVGVPVLKPVPVE
jgi:hypothetical protein